MAAGDDILSALQPAQKTGAGDDILGALGHAQTGAAPTFLQTLAASPIGRLAHDAVLSPIEGAFNLLHPVDFNFVEKPYEKAIAAQQNRPGYMQELPQQTAAVGPQGFTQQLTAPFNSSLAGIAGAGSALLRGQNPLNAMNAAADAQTAAQREYQQMHPIASGMGQTLGGLMAMPEGIAKAVPSYQGDNSIITRMAQGPNAPILPNPIAQAQKMTINQINAAKNAAYQVVDNSQMKIAAPEIDALHSDLETKLARMGLNDKTMPKLAPKVAAAMDSLEEAAASDQTLQAMDIQRRIANMGLEGTSGTERKAAYIIRDGIDDLISNLKPQQLSGPVDQAAIDALPQARDLANRSFKAQQLQNIIDKAGNNATGFSQSGYENALRNGFRKLLNNDRAIARFNPDEVAAIKQVATGGNSLSATNLLRQIGKLSPQGAIPLLAESGAVLKYGPSALGIPAAGIAGRTGATILQRAAAEKAVDLALSGAPLAPAPTALRLPAITSATKIPYGLVPFGFSFANQQAQ